MKSQYKRIALCFAEMEEMVNDAAEANRIIYNIHSDENEMEDAGTTLHYTMERIEELLTEIHKIRMEDPE